MPRSPFFQWRIPQITLTAVVGLHDEVTVVNQTVEVTTLSA